MNWPVALLHIIGSEQVSHACKFVQEAILETEHWRWPHNSSLRENASDDIFSSCLETECQHCSKATSLRGMTLVLKNSDGEFKSAL
jgi:hypothetical protein